MLYGKYYNTDTHKHKHVPACCILVLLFNYVDFYVSTDDTEQFLVISEAKAKDTETLKITLELLQTSQALVPLLDRNTKVRISLIACTHVRTDAVQTQVYICTHISQHSGLGIHNTTL